MTWSAVTVPSARVSWGERKGGCWEGVWGSWHPQMAPPQSHGVSLGVPPGVTATLTGGETSWSPQTLGKEPRGPSPHPKYKEGTPPKLWDRTPPKLWDRTRGIPAPPNYVA